MHARIELLLAAASLALPTKTEARRRALLTSLCPPDMTRKSAAELANGRLLSEIDRFLKSLASHTTPPVP
jgi:hypothetical protein